MDVSSGCASNRPEAPRQKRQNFTKICIIKNLVIVSFNSFLSFCAFDGLAVLQSTLNREDGIGVASVSIQYGCGCLSALLFPKYFITKFGNKCVMAVTSFTYVVYIAANFYPSWYLLVPASVLVGLANSLFWAAQCAYLNGLSILYADKLKIGAQLNNEGNIQKPCSTRQGYGYREGCSKDMAYQMKELDIPRNQTQLKENLKDGRKQYNGQQEYELSEAIHDVDNFDYKTRVVDLHSAKNCETNGRDSFRNELKKTMYCTDSEVTSSSRVGATDTSKNKINFRKYNRTLLESTTARIFGFHGLIFQSCHICSNLMSYYVLHIQPTPKDYIRNATCLCGSNFCNIETECFIHNLQEPENYVKYILLGLFVALSMFAVLIVVLFLDDLERKKEAVFLTWKLLFSSFRLMKNKFQILLIPMTAQVGVIQGFFMGDFTKAYIGCAWGVQNIGLVTVFWGTALALSCTMSGWFVKHIGRIPIFIIGEISVLASGVQLLLWYPTADNPAHFFVIAGLIGVSMGIIWSQLRAFYGVLFEDDEEVAFGNYQIFFSVGASMAFGYSNYLCTSVKIYIFIAIAIAALIGYIFAEKHYSLRKSIK